MNSVRETSSRIDDVAADWAARVDRGALSTEEQAALDAWCASDRRCLGAYARAQAVLCSMDRAQALGAGDSFELRSAAPAAAIAAFPPHRPWRVTAAMAAGLAALVIWLMPHWSSDPSVTTVKGELRQLPLPDGSSVTLNTATAIQTRFTAKQRVVELVQGEALFDVAKDPTRPFQVRAGELTIKAVGTSFTVRRMSGSAVQVVVREGVVEVVHAHALRPLRAMQNQLVELSPRTEAPGQSLVQRTITPQRVARELSWREGLISFEGVTLAKAAAEFERYSDIRIVVVEPELANKTITGLFAANNPAGFARAAAAVVDAHVSEHAGELRISRN
ncbi:FecR family protein [Roseateles toxinivorans]|uniref:FecR family protein n=1 Tax=Roseateles toxinivorans TaxID=270368 RepID=A0A4R6QQ75_9BURK|nr:FecR domain-containing protein [Roseateles toxinivorans]TDP72258.1 FecR family protein [Roseateles toxinivorans]